MNETTLPVRLRPLYLSLALAFCGAPMVAQSAAITLTAEAGDYGASRTVLIPQGGAYPYPASGFDYYAAGGAPVMTQGGNYFFHTYGFAAAPTFFGARASGENNFNLSTSATYTGTVTNSGSVAGMASFSFTVDSGDLGLFGQGVGDAGLLLQVLVNGVAVARSQTSISLTAGGVSCTENDLGALASYMACGASTANQVSGASQSYTINLGMLNPGESFNIEYDIIATASGQFTSGAVNCNYEDPGYGGYVEVTQVIGEGVLNCPVFNAITRSGDPFNGPIEQGFEPTQANFSTSVNPVPEPGSLALLGAAGLAGVAARRRALRGKR